MEPFILLCNEFNPGPFVTHALTMMSNLLHAEVDVDYTLESCMNIIIAMQKKKKVGV